MPIQWKDEGVVVHTAILGERGRVVTLMTRHHGRHRGFVRTGYRTSSPLCLGAHVGQVQWTSRLEDHLGAWRLDDVGGAVMGLWNHPAALQALGLMSAMVYALTPERIPLPLLYEAFMHTLDVLHGEQGLAALDAFEKTVCQELGYEETPWAKGIVGQEQQDTQGWPVWHRLQARQALFCQHWPQATKLHHQRQQFLHDVRTAWRQQGCVF